MKQKIHRTTTVPETSTEPFFSGKPDLFNKSKSGIAGPSFLKPKKSKGFSMNPIGGLSSSSFKFYEVTSNWKTAVVTGLFLSYSRYIFETGKVNFKVQVGVPMKLFTGDLISNSYAQSSCASAANLAVTTLGTLHHNEYGKPGWKATMPRRFAHYMQLYLSATIPGARVSTTITSSVKQHPAIWF